MSLRLGIDLVRIADVRAALQRFGDAYLARVFTPGEIDDCRARGQGQLESLAARFAAKEAVVKALEAGEDAIAPRQIEVRRSPSGACVLTLHGEALEAARACGVSGWAVSLTHEGEYAAAVVVAQGEA
jgi:holo-[acyl-carrier protein] synthase